MGIKLCPKIPWWYLMAMSRMRKQKFIDQLACKMYKIMRKKIQIADLRPFWILLVRNLSWVILVRDITFCFIFMVQLFCIFLSYGNITKLSQFKIATKRPF